ncbi:hypothetical protein ACIQU4_27620 [Streptomyces sp. NPDC090741]|uniref:hypothetical protein n=1 Tax=Streptomyces sp. NPDC090741 TaxID=3365967 RepID=UPI003813A6F2
MNSNRTLATPRRMVGDYDQSGEHMFTSLAEDVIAFAGAEVEFERVAVTGDQVAAYHLPTAPPKTTDRRSFTGTATTQAEALPPDILAAIVRGAVEAHRDPAAHREVLAREQVQRRAIRELLARTSHPEDVLRSETASERDPVLGRIR